MKVIQFVDTWLPTTQNWIYNQMKCFDENKIQNIIFTFKTQNLDVYQMKHIYSRDTKNKISIFCDRLYKKIINKNYSPYFETIIKKEKPDIIHSHFGTWGYRNTLLAKKYNIKHIVTFYGHDVTKVPMQQIWKERYKELFKNVSLVLCEGPYMAKKIQNLGCPKNKIQVQRLGIDLSDIKFIPRTINRNKTIRFLIAGTFKEKKGIPYAIEALGLLKNEFDDFKINIIGDSSNELSSIKEKSKIMDMIKKFKLSEKTTFHGFMSHQKMLQESYNNDIFISPSVVASDNDTEGGAPLSIIELAASGMPIISTTHCDIPNVLGESNKQILVRERDSFELKEQILMVLNNKINIESLINENRLFIEKNLNIDKLSKELQNKYLDL